jgi:predicted nucleotidyltransferase
MDKNQAIRIIKRFVKAVKKEGIFVDRVILYGSYARAEYERIVTSM